MAAINTLVREINNKLLSESFEKAFELYSDLLYDNENDWKLDIIESVAEQANQLKFNFLFSQNLADMLIIDDKNKQLILVWITESDLPDYEIYGYFEWMESSRKSLENDILAQYGYTAKVLHVLDSYDIASLDELYFENEDFYNAIPGSLDLEACVPKEVLEVEAENNSYDDFFLYCNHTASQLASLETPWPLELNSASDSGSSAPVSDFDILETAPESYRFFLHETRRALKNKKREEIFGLSLHSVFAGDNLSRIDQLTSQFADALSTSESDDSALQTLYYDFLDVSDKNDFSNYLENNENAIIVIENMEFRLTSAITFKKSDLIRILCKRLDVTKNQIFVLRTSRQGWKELVAEYPLLRVFFQNIFEFENLSIENLSNHFAAELKVNNLSLTDEALDLAKEFFLFSKSSQRPELFDFPLSTMLAREVRYFQATRVSQLLGADSSMIIKEDVENAIKDEYILQPKNNLKEVLGKIDHLTGLENVKKRIKDLAALVKINKLRNNGNASTPISLNSLFVGNPGTGKTTIALLLGEIYKQVGALQTGHVVAVSRQDIVSQWIGQTEENMLQLIKKAQGGILFIDEAYALYVEDSEKDFGREAINVLVDRLEAIKDHTCVILAGYPAPMKKFLNANPGLSSRFPQTVEFPDYSAAELSEIFKGFLNAEHFYMREDAEALISGHIKNILENKDKNFGNARTCRNLFESLKLIQARRITYSDDDQYTDLNLFTVDDVEVLLKEQGEQNKKPQSQKLGFKLGNQ